MKPLRVHEKLGYFNVDHRERCKCYYNDGNTGGIDFSIDTFENRCYYNVAIFEDGDFILSNYTFGSWFLVRVPENRCYFSVGSFENRCNESNHPKRGQHMT